MYAVFEERQQKFGCEVFSHSFSKDWTLLNSATSNDLSSNSDEARSCGMISGNGLKISADDPIKFFSRNSNPSIPSDVAK